MSKNNTVEFVRAFSAFYVMLLHVMIWCISWTDFKSLPNPKLAVDFFIVISGYLMMQVFYRNQEFGIDKRRIASFYVGRFFRIAPMYYVTLLLAVAISQYFIAGYTLIQEADGQMWPVNSIYIASKVDYSWTNIFLHLTFLFGFLPKASLSTLLPDWSIGLEMQFYLLLPAIFLLFRSVHAASNALILMIIASWLNTILITGMGFYEPSFLTLKLHCFILGMLLFLAIVPTARKAERYRYLLIGIGIALYQSHLYNFEGKDWRFWILPVFVLMFYFFANKDDLLAKLPSTVKRIISFMSDMSYSVYLLHGFFISACGLLFFKNPDFMQLGRLAKLAITLPFVCFFSYVFGYFCQRFIELPGIALGRKLSQRISLQLYASQHSSITGKGTVSSHLV